MAHTITPNQYEDSRRIKDKSLRDVFIFDCQKRRWFLNDLEWIFNYYEEKERIVEGTERKAV